MASLTLAILIEAMIVWGPAAIFLALGGDWGEGIVWVVAGLLVIVVVDNLLRPALFGKRLHTRTAIVFISVTVVMLFLPQRSPSRTFCVTDNSSFTST